VVAVAREYFHVNYVATVSHEHRPPPGSHPLRDTTLPDSPIRHYRNSTINSTR
jgi:hypothetical protein